MPSVSAYKKAFGLLKGLTLEEKSNKFILEELNIDHKVIKRYAEYGFPMVLNFRGPSLKSSKNLLLKLLKHKICSRNGIIVNSDYGNPYECTVGEPSIDEIIEQNEHEAIFIVKSDGFAFRRRDISSDGRASNSKSRSLSKQKSTKQNRPDLEVLRSRSGTSKCKQCAHRIGIGAEIAKRKTDLNVKGGWAHLKCL